MRFQTFTAKYNDKYALLSQERRNVLTTYILHHQITGGDVGGVRKNLYFELYEPDGNGWYNIHKLYRRRLGPDVIKQLFITHEDTNALDQLFWSRHPELNKKDYQK